MFRLLTSHVPKVPRLLLVILVEVLVDKVVLGGIPGRVPTFHLPPGSLVFQTLKRRNGKLSSATSLHLQPGVFSDFVPVGSVVRILPDGDILLGDEVALAVAKLKIYFLRTAAAHPKY